MRFSIVVPVYNVAQYLDECLQSILDQDYSDYEVILVDDGSTDVSGEICDRYCKEHEHMHVIHKENEGLLLARRTGILQANGDYILHCDSDDYVCCKALSTISYIIDSINPDMVLYGYNVVDGEHNVLEEHYNVFEDGAYICEERREELLEALSTTTWLNNMVTKATKRELVDIEADYSNLRSAKMGEDLLQVIPLVENCHSFYYCAKPLYCYRFNQQGMSKQVEVDYLWQYLVVAEKMHALLIEESVSSELMNKYWSRLIKDVNKYLLRFLKQGVSKADYCKLYRQLLRNDLYSTAVSAIGRLDRDNLLLCWLVKPRHTWFARLCARSLLRDKL